MMRRHEALPTPKTGIDGGEVDVGGRKKTQLHKFSNQLPYFILIISIVH